MDGPPGGAGNPLVAMGPLPEHTRVWLGWVLKDELLAQGESSFLLVVLRAQNFCHL